MTTPSTAAAPPPNRWLGYAHDGDQFFLAYLSLTEHESAPYVTSPWLFTGGHALELYLKAAQEKNGLLVGKSHAIVDRWNACRALAGCPLPFDMRAFDPDRTPFNHQDWLDALPKDEAIHCLRYNTVYMAAHHLTDIKYLGSGGATIPAGRIAYGFSTPDVIMISLLRDLRAWLGHDPIGGDDLIGERIARLRV